MNTRLVNTAADVISRAMQQGRSLPAALAVALDSAQMLQSPETVAESAHYRGAFEAQQSRAETLDRLLREAQARVAELEQGHGTQARPADAPPEPGMFRIIADLTNADDREDALYAAERVEYALTEHGYGCAVSVEAADAPLTIYRASHDSIPMGLYTTAAEARKHCETELRREWPNSLLDWIEDEEDAVAELVAENADGETPTGYVVEALEVAAKYDPEADE
ncbi:hypothetical protein [Streptomyces rochei]|uniref:hypothetical protein n=1 Tax=Streptomyces rochei TaxID=1928 RepID=UPI003627525D